MPATTNQKSCPFCKKTNDCMIKSENPCWCKDAVVSAKLVDMVPVELMRKSCICRECIELFNENPSGFISKYS